MEFPEPGFYRHYKFNSKEDSEKYLYEVLGVARNTEDESFSVFYRPLYANDFLGEAQYFSRPLENFCEELSSEMKRFTRITDPEDIRRLHEVRNSMYGRQEEIS